MTRTGKLKGVTEPTQLLLRSDGRVEHGRDRCPHPAEVVLLAETAESVDLAQRQLANLARRNLPPAKDGNSSQRMAYAHRPPDMEAARTETNTAILDGWAIRAAKRPELWRYRAVLLANPNLGAHGRKKLSWFVQREGGRRTEPERETSAPSSGDVET